MMATPVIATPIFLAPERPVKNSLICPLTLEKKSIIYTCILMISLYASKILFLTCIIVLSESSAFWI